MRTKTQNARPGRSPGERPRPRDEETSQGARTATPAHGDALRVLIAEDDRDTSSSLALLLTLWGHDVLVAHDGMEALRLSFAHHPDVVLLDLAMPPRLTPEAGLELIPRFAPAPVVVLTGHADHALALRAAELGAWDFLAKPADPDMLGFVVACAVRKAQLDAELRDLRARDATAELGLVVNA